LSVGSQTPDPGTLRLRRSPADLVTSARACLDGLIYLPAEPGYLRDGAAHLRRAQPGESSSTQSLHGTTDWIVACNKLQGKKKKETQINIKEADKPKFFGELNEFVNLYELEICVSFFFFLVIISMQERVFVIQFYSLFDSPKFHLLMREITKQENLLFLL